MQVDTTGVSTAGRHTSVQEQNAQMDKRSNSSTQTQQRTVAGIHNRIQHQVEKTEAKAASRHNSSSRKDTTGATSAGRHIGPTAADTEDTTGYSSWQTQQGTAADRHNRKPKQVDTTRSKSRG